MSAVEFLGKLGWKRFRCLNKCEESNDEPRILRTIDLLQSLQRAMGLPSDIIKYV